MAERLKYITISINGARIGNAGPGQCGGILAYDQRTKEIAGGFRWTTNNRAELYAAIARLQALSERCAVTMVCDSHPMVEVMAGGAAQRWRASGWMRTGKERVLKPDLWQ